MSSYLRRTVRARRERASRVRRHVTSNCQRAKLRGALSWFRLQESNLHEQLQRLLSYR
jgi:hypothetical protein